MQACRKIRLVLAVCLNLHANNLAQIDNLFVRNTVVNLDPIAALGQHTRLVQRIEVLGHIGLGGRDLAQEIRDILFPVAQAADDLQPHGCRHDPKHLSGLVEDVVWLVQFGKFLFGRASRHSDWYSPSRAW